MHKIGSVLLLLVAFTCYGQVSVVDSLLTEYRTTQGKQRVEILHELTKATWTNQPDSALRYSKEAVKLSYHLEDLKLQSISFRLLGAVYNYMSVIDSGRFYKNKALQIALTLNDSLLIAKTYNNLGVTSQTTGNYVEALHNYYMAYQMSKSFKEFKGLPIVVSNISEVYYDVAAYDSAKKYAEIAVNQTINDSKTSRHLLANNWLARSEMANGNTQKAKDIYQSIIEIGMEICEKRYTAYAKQGLGRLDYLEGKFDEAYEHFHEAEELFVELDDQIYVSEIYLDFSKLYRAVDFKASLSYANKSLILAKQKQLSDLQMSNYENFVDLYSTYNFMDSVQKYSIILRKLQAAKQYQINQLGIEGVFAKIEEERARSELTMQSIELERQRIRTYFFIAIALIILFFAALIFRYYRKQKKFGIRLEKINDRIAVQNRLIDRKNRDLNAINEEKDTLVNIVAHDLKNPLTNIINASQFVKNEMSQADETTTQLLGIIEKSALKLSDMVSKMLDVSVIEKGLVNIELQPVNLSSLLLGNYEEFQEQAGKKKLKLHLENKDNISIQAEETLTNQVLQNLISNAIKYSPEGKNIYIKLSVWRTNALIEVRDEGPGISEHEQTMLFQMFQKLSTQPTANESSTGLGLAIVKKYMDAMNGNIRCVSSPGSGATFIAEFHLLK